MNTDLSYNPKIAGIVLIGGKSQRMGSPKACLEINGEKLAIRTAKLLKLFTDEVYYSGRKEQLTLLEETSHQFIPDTYFDIGPMAGILSAFEWTGKTRPLLVTATDMPFLDKNTIQKLLSMRDLSKLATMYYHKNSGFLEPLCALYEINAYNVLLNARKKGKYAFHRIFDRNKLNLLPVTEEKALTNINSPDQLNELE